MTSYSAEAAIKKFRKFILDESKSSQVPLKEAAANLKAMQLPAALVDLALDGLLADQAKHRHVGTVLNPSTYAPWFIGPRETGEWAQYYGQLQEKNSPGLENLDAETSAITGLLANPAAVGAKRKGLVMGNVQSGKTRNFAGVIAKAADEGYKLVIVLSGINNNLREQTQVRLNSDLFDAGNWYPLTSAESDLGHVLKPAILLSAQELVCAVVKKNATRLRNLAKMLGAIPVEARRKLPILIVDDEADQATPNSLAEKKQISTINACVRDVWRKVGTGTYLAYTATPFANVLIDPDVEGDLFPSDFITTIDPGDGYFGAERVFGVADTVSEELESDGLKMVRSIPAAEAATLKPPSSAEERKSFDPELPESLRAAFHWFVVATAIRRVRGQKAAHSSMLVHTTHYTAPHRAMKKRLNAYRQELLADEDSAVARLKAAWDQEALVVAAEATLPLPAWDDVRPEAIQVLGGMSVIVDNGESDDRLNYDPEGPTQTVVAVGGGTLSRGLTLEGLVVSYFTRTSNTYDTLLQMGRWFGYRPGYEDLPRVWVTAGLDKDYAYLARVEKDLRDEIESLKDSEYAPRDLGVRVRAHPGRLEITARNKMFSADIVQLGLSGTANQTFLLEGTSSTIKHNLGLAADLVHGLNLTSLKAGSGKLIARKVSGTSISDFVASFRAHHDQRWLSDPTRRDAMVEWISKWSPGNVWNVVLAASGSGSGESIKIGAHEVRCLQRTPMKGSSVAQIDLKALMSQPDRIADIDPAAYDPGLAKDEAGRRRVRRQHGNGEGLLLLYPLGSQAKAPSDPDTERMDMPTSQPMLGFGIVFPHVDDSDKDQGTFVAVKRFWDVPLVVEGDEDYAEEQEDVEATVDV